METKNKQKKRAFSLTFNTYVMELMENEGKKQQQQEICVLVTNNMPEQFWYL